MHLLRRLAGHLSFHLNSRVAIAIPAFPSLTNSVSNQVLHYTLQRHSKSTAAMASTDANLRAFFQASKYAVVGASTNTEKYGFKVFRWYVTHGLSVTPINPGASAIEVDGEAFPTVASLSGLQSPDETAVSVITPPHVTQKTLEEAKGLGIQTVFLQPGTFNDDVLAYARENFATVLAGEGGAGVGGLVRAGGR